MIRVSARQDLDQVLQDPGTKTVAVVRGGAACETLADNLESRTQGFSWRKTVRLPQSGIINAGEVQQWFGSGPEMCAVVLSSVSDGRQVIGVLRSDASLMEIDNLLLDADQR